MNAPQFGAPEPGRSYPDRPAAFVVADRGGLVALVRVDLGGGRFRVDLPGGGLEAGESHADAAARECGEEAGLRVRIGDQLCRADHYFVNDKGKAHNTRGVFFAAQVEAEEPALKVEADHSLEWAEPLDAIRSLQRESHAWAVACWLRRAKA